jgi:Uma2 family endonuclease
MSTSASSTPRSGQGPAWDIATMYPDQGCWDEGDYLDLTDSTHRLIEFTDGYVEFLAMPTLQHQRILAFLFSQFHAFVTANELGEVLFAALRVRVGERKFREPDLVFMGKDRRDRSGERYWEGADFVLEIVSDDPKSRQRDWEQKRRDYAEARIPEYWIVDPQEKRIVVLKLEGDKYETHSEAGESGRVESALLSGFHVEAAEVFAAAQR